ncbi:MAG TPA: protoporphyrinogen oxidase [Rhodoglobus sp.]|nr:protoporphyrinogen oxidase [Rhodoglobus sp.]
MMRLLPLGIGLAVGYVLGTREGRERYDQLKAQAQRVWTDPRVSRTRRDVEAYARQQAPIIRERAEAAVKAAPGAARDAAGKVADTAKDAAGKVASTAKDVAGSAAQTAKDAAGKVADTAKDVAAKAKSTAGDLRGKGEGAVDSAVQRAGAAREDALEDDLDADRPRAI